MSRKNAERPTVEGAGQENYIPWEQIEPLLRPGMDADELKQALCRATGLDPERHVFATKTYTGDPNAKTLFDCLRDGLWVMRRPDMRADTRTTYIWAGDHRAPSSVGRAGTMNAPASEPFDGEASA